MRKIKTISKQTTEHYEEISCDICGQVATSLYGFAFSCGIEMSYKPGEEDEISLQADFCDDCYEDKEQFIYGSIYDAAKNLKSLLGGRLLIANDEKFGWHQFDEEE